MSEIDSLEIQLEISAKSSLSYLDKVEKKIDDITESLRSALSLSKDFGDFGNIDFRGIKSVNKQLKSISEQTKKISSQTITPKVKTKEVEKAAKSIDDLFDKFQNAGRNLDLSNIGLSDLEKEADRTEKSVKRLNDRLEKKMSLEGTENLGKSWESLVYDIQKATNQAEIYREAIDKIRNSAPKFTIERGDNDTSSEPEAPQKRFISPESLNYDPEAMKMVFGEEAEGLKNFDDVLKKFGGTAEEASIKLNELEEEFNPTPVNTYEAQIKRLKAELSNLASQGFKQGDAEYDEVAKELARVTLAKRNYDKEMSRSVQAGAGTNKFLSNLKSINKNIQSTTNLFAKFGKSASKSLNAVAKTVNNIKNALIGTRKQAKGMSFGQMLGSSVAFSFVFQGISAVQNAIKEGSDNLVQYSSVYNNSISSMVSALTYLKNAWVSAFAPIINVVSPYIQAFIDMLASALNALGRFLAALTGKSTTVQAKKVWQDYGASLSEVGKGAGDAAKGISDATKAAKEFQTYTLGIDELNIQPQSDNGSGSGNGGSGGTTGATGVGELLPSDMFETVEVEKSYIDSLYELGEHIGNALTKALNSIDWDKVYQSARNFGTGLADFLNGLITPRLFRNLGGTIAKSINTVFSGANAFAKKIKWDNLGVSIASGIDQFFKDWDAELAAETFSNFVSGLLEALTSAIITLDAEDTFETIGQKLVDFICGINWEDLTWNLAKFFLALSKAIINIPNDLARGIGQGIIDKIFGEDSGIEAPEIALPPTSMLGLSAQFDQIKTWALETASVIGTRFQEGWNLTQQAWSNGESFFSGLWQGIKYIFSPVAEFFGEKFDLAVQWIKNVFSPITTWFHEKWDDVKGVFKDVKDFFKRGFQEAYDAVRNIWNGLGNFFRGVAENAFKPIKTLVNGVIKGINWVLEKVGSGTRVSEWEGIKFAKGSNGLPQDTFGVVNDQPGSTYKELIVPPSGKPFIPEGRNVMLPLEKGTKIMPAKQTKAFMSSMPHFAGGIGDFFGSAWDAIKSFTGDVFDYLTRPGDIVKIAIDKFTKISDFVEPWLSVAGGMVNKTFDAIVDFVTGIFDTIVPKVNYSPSAGVEQWRSLAAYALKLTNQYSDANLNLLLYQMQTESGGNPNAINDWDINAQNGTPSKGLMQVIDPTFERWAMDGYDTNIWDPLSNMIAAIRYTVNRYGSLANGWKGHGYASGIGKINLSDLIPAYEVGGFPEDGLFFANHNELVGQFSNGKTAVANNPDIQKGIEEAAYRGFVRASAENTRETSLLEELIDAVREGKQIVVDGRELVAAYDRRKNRNGFSFT